MLEQQWPVIYWHAGLPSLVVRPEVGCSEVENRGLASRNQDRAMGQSAWTVSAEV
jgi:hypothetical protein